MSFFSYQHNAGAARPSAEPQPEMKVPPHMVIIDGTNLVKLVEDNPEIPEGKTDAGSGVHGFWQPLNYNPATGEML
jgi:hypothetical protein